MRVVHPGRLHAVDELSVDEWNASKDLRAERKVWKANRREMWLPLTDLTKAS